MVQPQYLAASAPPVNQPFKAIPMMMGILIGVVFGAGGYWWYQQLQPTTTPKNATSTVTPSASSSAITPKTTIDNSIDTKNWKTSDLELTNSSFTYPDTWTVEKPSELSSPQNRFYTINTSQGSIVEYNIDEWLKGSSDQVYVLGASDRAKLLTVMQELYSTGNLTDAIEEKLNDFSLEFMTYSSKDRVYVDYLESKDGKSKGLSMINTHGTDAGVQSTYNSVLFNKEKNSVLAIEFSLHGTEFDNLQEKYGDYAPATLGQIDKEAHASFIQLMNTTSRKDLSFSSQMDTVNQAIESWTY